MSAQAAALSKTFFLQARTPTKIASNDVTTRALTALIVVHIRLPIDWLTVRSGIGVQWWSSSTDRRGNLCGHNRFSVKRTKKASLHMHMCRAGRNNPPQPSPTMAYTRYLVHKVAVLHELEERPVQHGGGRLVPGKHERLHLVSNLQKPLISTSRKHR